MHWVVVTSSGLESEEPGVIEYDLDTLLLTQLPECQFCNSRHKIGRYFSGESNQHKREDLKTVTLEVLQ